MEFNSDAPLETSRYFRHGRCSLLACLRKRAAMPDPNKERAKQDIEAKIKDRNPTLLGQNLLIADLIARCRRYDRKERITDCESLRRELTT